MFDFFARVSRCEKIKVGNFNNQNSYAVISPILIFFGFKPKNEANFLHRLINKCNNQKKYGSTAA